MNTQDTMSREEKSEALNRLVIKQNVDAAHNVGSAYYLCLPLRTIEQVRADLLKKSAIR